MKERFFSSKGQVALFVIIGIILVVTIGLIFYFYSSSLDKSTEKQVTKETDLDDANRNVRAVVETCLNNVGKEGIILMSNSGLYIKPKEYVSYFDYQVAYLYDRGSNRVPTIEVMEKQLDDYVNENIENCIVTNYEIEFLSEPVTKTEILDDKVLFALELPIKMKYKNSFSDINGYTTEVPLRIGKLRNEVINEVVNQMVKDKVRLCLSCLIDISMKNNVYMEVGEINDELIFIVHDLDEDPEYVINFGGRV